MLCLDGVYAPRPDGGLRFARVKAPEREELEHLVQQIAERVRRALERMGAGPAASATPLSGCSRGRARGSPAPGTAVDPNCRGT